VIFTFFVPSKKVRRTDFRGEAPLRISVPSTTTDASMILKSLADFKEKYSIWKMAHRPNERGAMS
jgi:hypothetical protein